MGMDRMAHMDTVLPILLELHREIQGCERMSTEWLHRVGRMARVVDAIVRDRGDMCLLTVMNKFSEQTGEGIYMDASHMRRLVDAGLVITRVQDVLTCTRSAAVSGKQPA